MSTLTHNLYVQELEGYVIGTSRLKFLFVPFVVRQKLLRIMGSYESFTHRAMKKPQNAEDFSVIVEVVSAGRIYIFPLRSNHSKLRLSTDHFNN
jgi:hypothetical protein